MKVEMFYTPGCSACVATHDELRTARRKWYAILNGVN